MVWVGPPLSCKVPRPGLSLVSATSPPAPVFQLTLTQLLLPLPYRLPPLLVKVPPPALSTSSHVGAELPSMMLSNIVVDGAAVVVDAAAIVAALLPEMVSLLSVRVVPLLKMPPPLLPALLPEMVSLSNVRLPPLL